MKDKYTFYRIIDIDKFSYDPVDQSDALYWGWVLQKDGEIFPTLGGAKSSFGYSRRRLKGDTSKIRVRYEKATLSDWTEVV